MHKYIKNEPKQSPIICSDLVVKGLADNKVSTIRSTFKSCGEIHRVDVCSNNSAVLHFTNDEGRANALQLNGSSLIGP